MFDLSELDKLKNTRDKRSIPTVALYLDENNEYTGKYEVFESGAEASRTTNVSSGEIYKIINPKKNHYTATHRNGRKVTFVNAYSTIKEIKKHLNRVKNKKRGPKPVPVRMVYLDNIGEYEIFESIHETFRATGVKVSNIYSILNQKGNKYTAKHKRNDRKITFVNANTTQKEIDKRIDALKNKKKIRRKSISTKMIYLNENNECTEEYEIFESILEASEVTGIIRQRISKIINPKNNHRTSTHKINGRKVTFEKI